MRRAVPVLIAVALFVTTLWVVAQEAPTPPQPTEHHKQLHAGVGEWEGTLTSFMPGADAPMAARESVKAFGPFWIQTHFSCDYMGTVYQGSGAVGYDPTTKKYRGTWIDTMSSYLAIMEGTRDPETGVLTMSWESPDPTGKMQPHRYEAKQEGDTSTSTFYVKVDGEWTKSMVIEMKRKKAKVSGLGN